jgi:hypothetical protein
MKKLVAIALLAVAPVAFAAPAAAPAGATLTGEVLEVKEVSSYTYLRLKNANGEIWAAVPKAAVKPGAKVTIEDTALMTNFPSASLGKTFDKIVFGKLAGASNATAGNGATKAAPAAPAAGSVASMHGGSPAAADVADIKVPRATGPDARTVAEITATPAKLKDKPVLVRGKVVKYTPGVLGKNWIHLRDGSGVAADGTNDVLVTSKDTTKVGDIVLARGVVRTDVEVGPGYAYKVLVDDAKLSQ